MRVEKDGTIVIEDFQKGIGVSPAFGYDMRNIDIWTEPGIARVNYTTTKASATTIDGLVNWVAVNPSNGDIYALDDDGDLYKSVDDGSSWSAVTMDATSGTNDHGNGLAIWKGYLFKARDANLDVMNLSTGTWSPAFQSLTSDTSWHPILATSQDDRLTIGNGSNIAQLTEVTTFAPGTPATYSWDAAALDLPSQYSVKCLAELGNNLMIGTWVGTSITDVRTADIFPWDLNTHPESYGQPIRLEENGVNSMIVTGNILYIQAGIKGTIYYSLGTTAQVYREFTHLDFSDGSTLYTTPDGMAISQGKLLVAMNGFAYGVYSFKNSGNGVILNLENTLSSTPTSIGAIEAVGSLGYIVGWKNGSAQGIDRYSNSGRYSSFGDAYMDTPLFSVASGKTKKSYSEVEYTFSKPLTGAGAGGVQLKFRRDVTSSFSSAFATVTNSSHSGETNVIVPAKLVDLASVQFRIEMTGASGGTPTVNLKQIRIY